MPRSASEGLLGPDPARPPAFDSEVDRFSISRLVFAGLSGWTSRFYNPFTYPGGLPVHGSQIQLNLRCRGLAMRARWVEHEVVGSNAGRSTHGLSSLAGPLKRPEFWQVTRWRSEARRAPRRAHRAGTPFISVDNGHCRRTPGVSFRVGQLREIRANGNLASGVCLSFSGPR